MSDLEVLHMPKPEGSDASSHKAMSVSEAVEKLNTMLSHDDYTVVGEISEFQDKGWANVYFTIKDPAAPKGAIMRCAMWSNAYRNQNLPLEVGMKIEIVGRFEVYAPKGEMSFRVRTFKIAGKGDLRAQVEALAKKLQAEGLTSDERKRNIPAFPERVGIVTSPRGAVVHDMMRTLKERWPLTHVLVAGVPVEGAQAAQSMMQGISACVDAGCEVILLGRGGGSFEDLMPFNDEALARTVATCPVPVITAVGHEIDTTMCDLVSDRRASTPTRAAEFASAISSNDMYDFIAGTSARVTSDMKRRFDLSYAYLESIENRKYFVDAHELYTQDITYVQAMHARFKAALDVVLDDKFHEVEVARNKLAHNLQEPFAHDVHALEVAANSMNTTMESRIQKFLHEVDLMGQRMHDLSPASVMDRGYAIVRTDAGGVVSKVAQTHIGDNLRVMLADGFLGVQVTQKDIHDKTDA